MNNFLTAVNLKFTSILTNSNRYRRGNEIETTYEVEDTEHSLWLHLLNEDKKQSICIPKPYLNAYNNYVVGHRVVRAVGTWALQEQEYTYWKLMSFLLTSRIDEVFPTSSKKSYLQRLVESMEDTNTALVFRSCQDLINQLVNRLPLVGTPMQTHAMCNRVVFLDPKFTKLTPEEALNYQVDQNKKFFPWTSVGLSDSGMCNNNLLKLDLRKFTPFGIKHHNPMRNLYQTLGMRGNERPYIVSESMHKLEKETNIKRQGWNLMTCFLDLPINFEDQLIVDKRHLNKLTLDKCRYICHGELKVSAGDELVGGDVISIEPNGKELIYSNCADRSVIVEISKDKIPFNGQDKEVHIVYIETKHVFKEGIKLTNRHGNKGVVSFADCGWMLDEGRQEKLPIDIIVSAKTIGRRKNFGQVLECLTSLVEGKETELVLPDNIEVNSKELSAYLNKHGYNSDGTSEINTPWYKGNAICGWGFWGLIKNPENQLWEKRDVLSKDNRGLRRAGLKLSHIELRSLITIFGAKNPVINEIMQYQQGTDDVCDLITALRHMRGGTVEAPLVAWQNIKPLIQSKHYFHPKNEIINTIADSDTHPNGFILTLPNVYHLFIPNNKRNPLHVGIVPQGADMNAAIQEDGTNVFCDKVYIPRSSLRNCWQHATGLWGLSDTGGYLNNIVIACYQEDPERREELLLRALSRYFYHVAAKLSTKSGELATHALSIRYPHSAKATATLATNGLPLNHVEIHQDMAEDLGVKTGDLVIAERFPCLGFKSIRVQKVVVTDDPQCKFVIRVSGNSLVSQNLDFDGDVLYLMAFKTEAAIKALEQEFNHPHKLRKFYIDEANAAKVPFTGTASLETIGLRSFPKLTADKQAEIVASLTGVKRGTGSTIALSYNLMRIIEGSIGFQDKETNLTLEVILDKVANSVFSQKHDEESLEKRCKKAICTADLNEMLAMGFPADGSKKLCDLIVSEAQKLGINDLHDHYKEHLTKGRSNVINTIVRKKHRFYYATRSNLDPMSLLEHIDSPAVDLTSHMWKRIIKLKEKKNAVH